jgi:hypothetical protein
MFIDYLEHRFNQLGLPSERPRLVLAIPLIATLSADSTINRFEKGAVEDFARDTLHFDALQMSFLSSWLQSPPSDSLVRDALSLIEDLLQARDMVAIETQTLTRVLMQCERLLRLREIENESTTSRGRKLLEAMQQRLNLDWESAWQEPRPMAHGHTAARISGSKRDSRRGL